MATEKNEPQSKEKQKSGWAMTILSLLLLAVGIAGIVFHFPWWLVAMFWLSWLITLILAMWTEWAPKSFVFTFVPEGYIKAVLRSGEIHKVLFRWEEHRLATKADVEAGRASRRWDVMESPPLPMGRWSGWWSRLFGGFHFVGIPPFQRIMTYTFEWSHLHEDGSVHHHKEKLDYLLAKWDSYVIEIPLGDEDDNSENKGAEDKAGIPLGVTAVFPMRVINPYEAFFEIGRWLPMVMSLIRPPLIRFIGRYRYREDLVPMKSGKNDLWKVFWKEVIRSFQRQESQSLMTFRNEKTYLRIYGVVIDKSRSGILALDPSKSFRKLTTLQYEASQKAEETKIQGIADGTATANRITIAVTAIAKQLAGFSHLEDDELTENQWAEIKGNMPDAYANYLTQKGIEAIKPSDKVIITKGGESVGGDMAGLVVKEVVRQRISETAQKNEEEESDKED